jgi:hypothetical protein
MPDPPRSNPRCRAAPASRSVSHHPRGLKAQLLTQAADSPTPSDEDLTVKIVERRVASSIFEIADPSYSLSASSSLTFATVLIELLCVGRSSSLSLAALPLSLRPQTSHLR